MSPTPPARSPSQPRRASRGAAAGGRRARAVAARPAAAGDAAADAAAAESADWVGYEAAHPLTWVPGLAPSGWAQ